MFVFLFFVFCFFIGGGGGGGEVGNFGIKKKYLRALSALFGHIAYCPDRLCCYALLNQYHLFSCASYCYYGLAILSMRSLVSHKGKWKMFYNIAISCMTQDHMTHPNISTANELPNYKELSY